MSKMSTKKKNKEPLKPEEVAEILNVSVLHEMINTLEDTKLKLLLNIKEQKEKLAQQKEDQADIYYYLNKKCDESFETIASLEEQIINEQTDREISEKLYESKLEEAKGVIASNELKFTSKISELETKLEMLNSYTDEKQEMQLKLKELMAQLESERLQFKVNAENIENKFLVERDKLRRSYDIKYETIKKELEASVENKLSKKTKKTQIMNVVMKKELDNQSKHAEKLLEVNEAIMERDRTLKLELELANSLQQDMTTRLAFVQRSSKQLNEQIAKLEREKQIADEENSKLLTSKAEQIIRLEAQINKLNKQKAVENAKLDEMWHFLAQSYQLLKSRSGSSSALSSASNLSTKSVTESDAVIRKPAQSAAVLYDHEKMLVELVKSVAAKYPKLLSGAIAAAQLNADSIAATDATSGQLLSASGSIGNEVSLLSIASRKLPLAAASSSYSSASVSSSATGIPAWDMKTAVGDHYKVNEKSIRVRSVHVQTESKLTPYPPQGSGWLQAAADSSSVGPQSVNTWWDGGSYHSQMSLDDDAHSVKTMSHIAAPRKERIKHIRGGGGGHRAKKPAAAALAPAPTESLVPALLEGKTLAQLYRSQLESSNSSVSASWSASSQHPLIAPPDTLPLPLPLHQQQPSFPGLKSPTVPPIAFRQSHSNFSARPGNFLHHIYQQQTQHSQQQQSQSMGSQQLSLSADMAISGQGFIAPMLLPKLEK